MYANLIILGCGWAGVLVAEKYGNVGIICIDKDVELGGLLKTVNINGFVIDVGGSHVIFSRDATLLNKLLNLLENNVIALERRAYVLLNGFFVPYPLENGLYVLPIEERLEAITTFIETLLSLEKDWIPKNFEEWIYRFFGDWVAKKYLIPYNNKVWKRPLTEIDVDWVYTPGRLPVPDWKSVVKSAMGIPTTGYKEQAKFYYPLRGGIQALYNSVYQQALAKGVTFERGIKVRSIKILDDGFLVNGGYIAKRLISTIPLPDLINALEGQIYDDLKEYTKYFDYNRVITVAVAVNKRAPPHHWVYVPDERIIFHRYAWLSNYSPYSAPEGKGLLLAEITMPPNQDIDKNLVERVLKDLERLNIVDSRDVIFAKMWINEHGYPIHRIKLAEVRDYILNYLKGIGITSLGRWGSWRYLNTDAVMRQVEQTSL